MTTSSTGVRDQALFRSIINAGEFFAVPSAVAGLSPLGTATIHGTALMVCSCQNAIRER